MIAHKQDCGLTHTTSGASIASYNEDLADHLLANGVTFATDKNDGGKWIPITKDTMPEKEKDVLLCFGKNIAVGYWTEGNKALNVWWWANTGEETSCYCEDIPTHWAEIPEPPERKRND